MNTSANDPNDERKPSGEPNEERFFLRVEPRNIFDDEEFPRGTISEILDALSAMRQWQISSRETSDRQAQLIQSLQRPRADAEDTVENIYESSLNSAYDISPHPQRSSQIPRNNNVSIGLDSEFDRQTLATNNAIPVNPVARADFSAFETIYHQNQVAPVNAIREISHFVPPTAYPSSNNTHQQQRRQPINQHHNRRPRANNNYNDLPPDMCIVPHPPSLIKSLVIFWQIATSIKQ